MLEADALQRVVQFDIDAEVVGIELHAITGTDALFFVDIQGQRCDAAGDG